MTTHYLEESERLIDIIGIIDKGRLLDIGTLEELRRKLKYQYNIRISDAKMLQIKARHGNVSIGAGADKRGRSRQIIHKLIRAGARFSSNPLSLEDIFYYYAKKPIEE